MSWLSVSFEVAASEVDAVSDALFQAGALAVDVADAAAGSEREEPMYAEGGEAPRAWRRSVVRALVAANTDAAALVAAACGQAGLETASYRVQQVADQDWVRLTQAQFAPIRISRRLWVVPTWHAAPDPAAVNIVLDPGVAFGTGMLLAPVKNDNAADDSAVMIGVNT